MDLKQAFASSELLGAASPAALAMLASCATLKRVGRGETLFHEKESVHTLYIMAQGLAALCRISENGERRVIFLYGEGEALNEVALCSAPASIQCELLQDSLLLCLPVACVRQAMAQDFPLAQAVMDSMALKIRRLYRQMKNSSTALRGDKRVAAKLWKLSRDFGVPTQDGILIRFELSITFLADMLGSKRETVSRQVKVLTQAGLVRFEEGRFLILDRDALKKYYQTP